MFPGLYTAFLKSLKKLSFKPHEWILYAVAKRTPNIHRLPNQGVPLISAKGRHQRLKGWRSNRTKSSYTQQPQQNA